MNTQAVGQSHPDPLQANKQTKAQSKASHTGQADRAATSPTRAQLARTAHPVAEFDTPTTDVPGSERANGVLRLLEAGHFKGVADVRLRINLFDELSAGMRADAARVAREESVALAETVGVAVGDLVAELELDAETGQVVAEMVGGFRTAVLAAADEPDTDTGFNPEALQEAIQSAFDTLVDRLTDLLGEGDDEAPSPDNLTPEAALESTEGPQATFDEAIASLVSAFDDALSSLVSSLNAASELPDPAPPSGNGAAYEKFLAIYNELRGGTNAVDERV